MYLSRISICWCLLLRAHNTVPWSHVVSSELGSKGQEVGLNILYYQVKEQHSKWRTAVVSRRAGGLSLGWIWELGLLFTSVCAKPFALSTWQCCLQCTSAEFSPCLCTMYVQTFVFEVSAGRQRQRGVPELKLPSKLKLKKCANSLIPLKQRTELLPYSHLLPTSFPHSTGSKGCPKWRWVKLRWGRNSTSLKGPAQHGHHQRHQRCQWDKRVSYWCHLLRGALILQSYHETWTEWTVCYWK